ncbi:hypothetical protein HMPREF9946_04040 [Acetobacteraceae bacterium AT-5844]|nr:hypothetical protein HMPREF9946_04040 [Acetobacteraceae bacterium AT-5844]
MTSAGAARLARCQWRRLAQPANHANEKHSQGLRPRRPPCPCQPRHPACCGAAHSIELDG